MSRLIFLATIFVIGVACEANASGIDDCYRISTTKAGYSSGRAFMICRRATVGFLPCYRAARREVGYSAGASVLTCKVAPPEFSHCYQAGLNAGYSSVNSLFACAR